MLPVGQTGKAITEKDITYKRLKSKKKVSFCRGKIKAGRQGNSIYEHRKGDVLKMEIKIS